MEQRPTEQADAPAVAQAPPLAAGRLLPGLAGDRLQPLLAGGALASAVLLGALLLSFQYVRSTDGYMSDDAFISFRYAVNLSEGHGPVWQPGDRVEGYTNFAWVVLLGGAHRAGVDPVDSSRAFGLLASAVTLALLPVLAAQLRPAWSPRWWVLALGSMLALGVNSAFALWTFAGLETTAAACMITAALTLTLYEERKLRLPVFSPLAFVGAALVRPDAIVVWGVVLAYKLVTAALSRRLDDAKRLSIWGALFVLPFGAYWLWRWSYYGDFFPNTYYLKTGRTMALIERGGRYAWTFVTSYALWPLLLAAASAWSERARRYRPATLLLAVLAAWTLYVIDAGGDWMPQFRFFVPVVPVLYVLMIHGAIDVSDRLAPRAGRRRAALPAMLAAAALIVALSVRPHDDPSARNPAGFVEHPHILPGAVNTATHRKIGLWLRDNLPQDATVAQIATGIVPYYSELPTLDMLGVNDRHIARRDIPLGHGAAGHEKEDAGYVIMQQPDVIWLALALESVPRTTEDDYRPPRYDEWVPVKVNIVNNAYVWFFYRPVAVQFDDGWLNLLLHTDATLPGLGDDGVVDARGWSPG